MSVPRRAVRTRVQVQGISSRHVVAMIEFDYESPEELDGLLSEAKKALNRFGTFDTVDVTWEESKDFLVRQR